MTVITNKQQTEANNRMYVVIRKDLPLSKGKWMAQVTHAVMRNIVEFGAPDCLLEYCYNDRNTDALPRALVLYVKSEKALINLHAKLRKDNVRVGLQVDAGFNEVERGTPTCLAIGPISKEAAELYTKKLQTFKE